MTENPQWIVFSFSLHDAITAIPAPAIVKALKAIIRRALCNIILFSQPNLVITINQIDWPFGSGQI